MFQLFPRITTKQKCIDIKKKKIKVYHYRKLSTHKKGQQEKNRGTKILQNSQKTIIKKTIAGPCLS